MSILIHKKPDGSERRLELNGVPLVIGRVAEAPISVRDVTVSRGHCSIGFTDNHFILHDLHSANGTFRNGVRVTTCTLASGDKIQIGNSVLIFVLDPAGGHATLHEGARLTAPAPHSPPKNPRTVLLRDEKEIVVKPLGQKRNDPEPVAPPPAPALATPKPVTVKPKAAVKESPLPPPEKSFALRRLEAIAAASPPRPFTMMGSVDSKLLPIPGAKTIHLRPQAVKH